MLRTRLCDLLGIEAPIIQGPLGGPWGQSMDLPAAVCAAGGLGSIATSLRTADQFRHDLARLRELTDRPFAVNHTRRPFSEEVFAASLEDPPAVISLALGEPGDLVARAHDAGALFLQQVTTVEQARQAADAGADVISAQGMESGGFSGAVSTLALVPQVVDAVRPLPVVASGGIADGRGLAAALVLGAEGVNIGTRFLASEECRARRVEAVDPAGLLRAGGEGRVLRPRDAAADGGWLRHGAAVPPHPVRGRVERAPR